MRISHSKQRGIQDIRKRQWWLLLCPVGPKDLPFLFKGEGSISNVQVLILLVLVRPKGKRYLSLLNTQEHISYDGRNDGEELRGDFDRNGWRRRNVIFV